MLDAVLSFLTEGQAAGARYRLAAPGRPPLGAAGSQLGRAAGESMEFMDHREYQPGDDLRRLDWAAFARSDKMIVKLYQQEVSPHLDLVIDGSKSMTLGETQKPRAVAGLAAALCTAAANAGHTQRVYLTGGGCRPLVNGSESPSLWQGLAFDSSESPPESFRVLPPAWRQRGIRVFLTDLLWLDDPLELLSPLGQGAAAVYIIQVLAAEDVEPDFQGAVRLTDSETDDSQEAFLDASALARYRDNLRRHRDNWRQAVRQVGALMVSLVAEDVCRDWDLSPLAEAGILTIR